jgi:hypothetical protein
VFGVCLFLLIGGHSGPTAITPDEKEPWTMEQVKRHREKIHGKASSIVGKVIWDFIQTNNYIFPVLHFEIGTFNIILDSFYCFVEDQIEILPEDKKLL